MTVYFFIILLVCAFDQLTKLYSMDVIAAANNIAVSELYEGATKPILDGILNFTFIKNDGMAFGLLGEHRWIFMTLSTVGIVAMLVYLIYLKGEDKLFSFSLSLVIGGGIGNMFDRILLGYVVDFIDVRCFSFWKWIFNFADSAVCVGAGLIILAVILEYAHEGKKK
ncbi:MAG: signal peptidase II [Ruminococcaceae bacterium]|nr:signal peptidase II [Oscillospiraceae bacterium]